MTQGEANEYIYFVFKGKVKILLDAATLDTNNFCLEKEEGLDEKKLHMQNETTGAIFGEESALDGGMCNFSV